MRLSAVGRARCGRRLTRAHGWLQAIQACPHRGLPIAECFDNNGIMDASIAEPDVIKALAALAQPLRLQVFRALVVVGDAGLTPGAMQEGLGVAPATLSFHLKELVNAGLVTQERVSRNLVYRAHYAQMNAVLGYLTENCCQGASCTTPAATCC